MEMNDVVDYMKEQFLENLSVRSTAGTHIDNEPLRRKKPVT